MIKYYRLKLYKGYLMTQNQLYNALYNLRSQLKKQFSTGGRAPSICTDEALQELAAHPPMHKNEITNISGIGSTFVEKYGDYFMPIFHEYYSDKKKSVQKSPHVQDTLKSLENRLVNISRKNRLLYMGKIYNKTAFDLYNSDKDYNEKVIDIIMGKNTPLTICDISLKDNWDAADKRFKKALQLIREHSKDLRETGQTDLFIGYPFVMGKTFGEDFSIRAPLVLFPVIIDKTPNKITIKLDKTQDIMFNSNLILTQKNL